jgi:epoxide hydrolase-like predicted phosphatase
MKPDPAIYELALQRLDVPAAEAVFVDDFPVNVAAAREAGLHAIHFRGMAPLRRSLEELGVTVPPLVLDPLPGIQAVIFDWGGVLERAPDAAHLAQWEQRLGLEPGLLARVLWREMGYQLETGEITREAYAQHVADRLELPDAAAGIRLVEQIFDNDWLYDEMVGAVRRLRRRYKVALLSNAFAEQAEWIQRLYGLDLRAEFDVYVNSALVGLRKPDWAIFRLTLEQLGVEAEQAVFIDDSLRNVDAAASLGLHALQCADPATTLAQLRRLLGEAGF